MILFKKITFVVPLFFAFAVLSYSDVQASTSASVGYFNNKSNDTRLNYLEVVLPNSLNTALKQKFRIKSRSPRILAENLKKDDLLLKKQYSEIELPKLSESLDTDYFIYGDFEVAGKNMIKLEVNIYEVNSFRIFTFTDYGHLETEIFKFIDRVAAQINGIISDEKKYSGEVIKNNSAIGIITNLSGKDLNELYYGFMKQNYSVKNFQGNTLNNIISECTINNFYYMSSDYASYRLIARKEDVKMFYNVWTEKKQMDELLNLKRIYDKYAFNFTKTQNAFIDKINSIPNTKIDYLIIIGFDDDHETAWIRCINMSNKRLIYTQSEIESDTVSSITQKIIDGLQGKQNKTK